MHPHPDEIEVGPLVNGADRDRSDTARRPHHDAMPTVCHRFARSAGLRPNICSEVNSGYYYQSMFTVRFDMRAPAAGAPKTDLYRAAIDMCAGAESRGAIVAVLSEHHGAEDNHLPSPIVLAAAIAARTERLPIMLAA